MTELTGGIADIRPIELRDAPAIAAAVDCSRSALSRWMVWYHADYCLTDAERWVRHALADHAAGTGFHFAICDVGARLVGVLSLEGVDRASGRAMLGYWVATPATGHGIARDAVGRVLTWASTQTDLRVVWALVAAANGPSRRVVEANGFREIEARERDARGDIPLVYEHALDAEPAA